MPLPKTIDICRESLFDDREKMESKGVPAIIQERIIRLRDLYNFWLNYPSKKDREIVQELINRYGIQRSAAYEDVSLIRYLLGDLNKAGKDFHLWKFNNMITKAYEMAERRKDPRSMVAAADKYGKYNKLDKEDALDHGFDRIQIQPFEPTDDPSAVNMRAIPNLRKKISDKIRQYWNEDIEDIDFDPVEFNEDKIFNPPVNNEAVS